jgi:hypothetical protein
MADNSSLGYLCWLWYYSEPLPTVVPVLAGMSVLPYQLGTSIKVFSQFGYWVRL